MSVALQRSCADGKLKAICIVEKDLSKSKSYKGPTIVRAATDNTTKQGYAHTRIRKNACRKQNYIHAQHAAKHVTNEISTVCATQHMPHRHKTALTHCVTRHSTPRPTSSPHATPSTSPPPQPHETNVCARIAQHTRVSAKQHSHARATCCKHATNESSTALCSGRNRTKFDGVSVQVTKCDVCLVRF